MSRTRTMRSPAIGGACAAALAIFGTCTAASAATTYSVTNLGVPSGFDQFSAQGINAAGVVAGWSRVPGSLTETRGFVHSPAGGGTFTLVPQGQGAPSWNSTYAINGSGQVAGGGYPSPPFVWNTGLNTITTIPDINAPHVSEGNHAYAINARGAVVGSGWDFEGGGGERSYLWQPHAPNGTMGTIVSLGGGGGGTSVTLAGINDAGLVIGTRQPNNSFLWKPSAINGTTGTFFDAQFVNTSVRDINNAGQLVGRSGANGNALLWTPDQPNGTTGTFRDLGRPPGTGGTAAEAINDAGVVVGQIVVGPGRAFVWSASDGLLDLNTLLDTSGADWTLEWAADINDAGLIIGSGLFDPDGPGGAGPLRRAFLLTPIPEPSGVLIGAGLLASVTARRRNHSAGQLRRVNGAQSHDGVRMRQTRTCCGCWAPSRKQSQIKPSFE